MTHASPGFAAGDPIQVVQGPFTDFKGIVTDAAPAPGKVAVTLALLRPEVSADAGRIIGRALTQATVGPFESCDRQPPPAADMTRENG